MVYNVLPQASTNCKYLNHWHKCKQKQEKLSEWIQSKERDIIAKCYPLYVTDNCSSQYLNTVRSGFILVLQNPTLCLCPKREKRSPRMDRHSKVVNVIEFFMDLALRISHTNVINNFCFKISFSSIHFCHWEAILCLQIRDFLQKNSITWPCRLSCQSLGRKTSNKFKKTRVPKNASWDTSLPHAWNDARRWVEK